MTSSVAAWRRTGAVTAFGGVFAFASSLGQTFFISLFVPFLAADLGRTETALAAVYGLATVAAAVLLPWIGRLVDRVDLLRLGGVVVAVMLAAGLAFSQARGLPVLVAALILLRLCGQGLMSHIALSGVARYVARGRAKALAVAGLGHAVGEGLLPLTVVFALGLWDWRVVFAGASLVIGGVLAPVALWAVRGRRRLRRPARPSGRGGEREGRPLLRDPRFWALAPALLAAPFIVTGLVFHQGLIARGLALPPALFAAGFVGFAVVQAPAALIAGAAIDRYGSRAVLLVHLLPLAGGVALLTAWPQPWAPLAFLLLAGVTNAWGGLLRTTLATDLAGVSRVGAARSQIGALMVVSTAAGPTLVGLVLGLGTRAGLAAIALGAVAVVAPAVFVRTSEP